MARLPQSQLICFYTSCPATGCQPAAEFDTKGHAAVVRQILVFSLLTFFISGFSSPPSLESFTRLSIVMQTFFRILAASVAFATYANAAPTIASFLSKRTNHADLLFNCDVSELTPELPTGQDNVTVPAYQK